MRMLFQSGILLLSLTVFSAQASDAKNQLKFSPYRSIRYDNVTNSVSIMDIQETKPIWTAFSRRFEWVPSRLVINPPEGVPLSTDLASGTVIVLDEGKALVVLEQGSLMLVEVPLGIEINAEILSGISSKDPAERSTWQLVVL